MIKSFFDDYNTVVEQAGNSETKDVLRNAAWMTGITGKTGDVLSKVGITVGKGNKLEFDEEALKQTTTLGKSRIEIDNIPTLISLFTGYGPFADKIVQKHLPFPVLRQGQRAWIRPIISKALIPTQSQSCLRVRSMKEWAVKTGIR